MNANSHYVSRRITDNIIDSIDEQIMALGVTANKQWTNVCGKANHIVVRDSFESRHPTLLTEQKYITAQQTPDT